jgi:hypothetical protein
VNLSLTRTKVSEYFLSVTVSLTEDSGLLLLIFLVNSSDILKRTQVLNTFSTLLMLVPLIDGTDLLLLLTLVNNSDSKRERHTGSTVIEFEVLTAVFMKISFFWGITLCSPSKISRRF